MDEPQYVGVRKSILVRAKSSTREVYTRRVGKTERPEERLFKPAAPGCASASESVRQKRYAAAVARRRSLAPWKIEETLVPEVHS